MDIKTFENYLYRIQGKTIAVVYIFEGENASGYEHYDIWKSDVISEWILSIQENNCRPLIMDARTFISKVMNHTLPIVDAVINLNNGNIDLSTLSLVPSVCSFIDIPCIPCNATSIISGENKLYSNCIAQYCGIQLPDERRGGNNCIYRPFNYGSSRGTRKIQNLSNNKNGIYQEFITGYDITTPILYDPLSEDLSILPTVMYYSEDKNTEWFFNEKVKEKRSGYKKQILTLDKKTEEIYLRIAKTIQIKTFCRIDARIKCSDPKEWNELVLAPIPFKKIYFIEINPMPTIKKNINFHNSIDSISQSSNLGKLYEMYKKHRQDYSPTGFILFCSLMSILKPSIKEKGIDSILTDKI